MSSSSTYTARTRVCGQKGHAAIGCVAVAFVVLSGCSHGSSEPPQSVDTAPSTTTATATTAPRPSSVHSAPSSVEKAYAASVSEIGDATAHRLYLSWRPGCPVQLEELRLLRLPHATWSGETVVGELVVHADSAEDIVAVFEQLYRSSYPIERMQLVDDFEADDAASMKANNTSGFNCREVAGRPGVWSQHAYGRAIDINPIQNPYVRSDGSASPEAGERYLDRDPTMPGLITDGDVVVSAFAAVGWSWGGNWPNSKDYQHFSATGG